MSQWNEAPGQRAHLPALADPRAHPRLPARTRAGAADPGRAGRLSPAGAGVRLGRTRAKALPPPLLGAADDPTERAGVAGARRRSDTGARLLANLAALRPARLRGGPVRQRRDPRRTAAGSERSVETLQDGDPRVLHVCGRR